VGPGAGLDRCGKSCPTGIRSPDLPTRSESLYRLTYSGSSNDNDRGKSEATLSTTNLTGTNLELNPVFCRDIPAPNGTAF
jgi:hypothetical protein